MRLLHEPLRPQFLIMVLTGFSIVEMKALLFAIVRAFEIDMAVPAADIVPKTMIVTRPALMSNPDAGPQLPLLIRPIRT